jgi:integrase
MTTRSAPRRARLSELAVRRYKPEAASFQVWDTLTRGLALRVQPTGRRGWYYVYSRGGRPRWLYLGDAGAIGLKDARGLVAEHALTVARGGDPAAERRAERLGGSFAELAASYVERHAKKHNRSWKQGAGLIERYLLPKWGPLQAASISRSDVRREIERIKAPVLANMVLAHASAVFGWAVREELLTENPCRGVRRNKVASRERVLSDSELPLFWSRFDDAGLVVGSALKVLLLLGQRPGEISSMRREHIKDGWWELPGAPVAALGWPGTKNSQSHRVWLPQVVRELIAELTPTGAAAAEEGGGFVFGADPENCEEAMRRAMRDICSRLKVERATPHDLRRTHGTTVTGLGFGRDALNRIQNHIEGGIAGVYDRFAYVEENKRVMEAVAARIMMLVEGRGDDVVVPLRR